MKNDADPQPWDDIYQREGRVFTEPFPRFEALVDDFKAHACEEILDLGCGNGRHVVHLTLKGFRVTGMDNSPTALRMTQEWLADDGMSAALVLGDMRAPHRILRLVRGEMCGMHISGRSGQDVL